MPTKLETLKAKLEKQQKMIEELAKQVEEEQMAELKAEEFAQKSADTLIAIAAASIAIFKEAGLQLPEGRLIQLASAKNDIGEDVFVPQIVATSKPKTASSASTGEKRATGGATRHTIVYEGKECSWADVADELGIAYGQGSAHKAVFDKNRAAHDAIPHENCPYIKAAPATTPANPTV